MVKGEVKLNGGDSPLAPVCIQSLFHIENVTIMLQNFP